MSKTARKQFDGPDAVPQGAMPSGHAAASGRRYGVTNKEET